MMLLLIFIEIYTLETAGNYEYNKYAWAAVEGDSFTFTVQGCQEGRIALSPVEFDNSSAVEVM